MKNLRCLLAALVLLSVPAWAQDKPAEAPVAAPAPEEGVNIEAAEEFKEKAEDMKAGLQKKLDDMRDGLDEKQSRHFGIIYYNHNMIETVKTVRDDVGNAVKSCSEKNPDMEKKITERYADWTKAVNERLTEAEGLTQSMMFAQDYASEDEMKDILKSADTLRTHSQTIYEKVPVTTPEACDYLYEKMLETKESMLTLLSSALISVPQEMQKSDEIEGTGKKESPPAGEKPAEENVPEKDAPEEKPAE